MGLIKGSERLPRFTLEVGFHRHPKFLGMSAATIGVFVAGQSYCAEHGTDGQLTVLPVKVDVLALALGVTAKDLRKAMQELRDRGVWVEQGGSLVVAGYLDHNPSSAQVKDKARRRSVASEKANHANHHAPPDGTPNPEVCSICAAEAANGHGRTSETDPPPASDSASEPPSEPPSDSDSDSDSDSEALRSPRGDKRRGEERREEPSTPPPPNGVGPTRATDWSARCEAFPEVVHDLVEQFRAGLVDNAVGSAAFEDGTKRHHDWLQAIDRLLRTGPPGGRDTPVDPETVADVIAFVLVDEFERANVHSPGKLRKRWDQLAMKARQTAARRPPTPTPTSRDGDWSAGWEATA